MLTMTAEIMVVGPTVEAQSVTGRQRRAFGSTATRGNELPITDESILKSSHRSRGKFAIFGHHHLLRRRHCELRIVG
jgi:hypothetical protein